MQWTKKDLPFSVQNKPTEIVNKGLAAANKALLNGKSKVEATLVALGTIRAIEQALNPVVEPIVPTHVSLLKAQEEPKNTIHRAFLGKNALPTDSDRVLVSADFNEQAQLVLVFDTGETLTTKSIITEEIMQQFLTVTTGSTGDITGLTNPTDYLGFNTNADLASDVGELTWNETDGTLDLGLKGGNVTLQVGQEQLVRVLNKTGTPMVDMQVVRITGAQGNRLTVGLSIATDVSFADNTFAVVTESILNNHEGFCTTSGLVRNVDTSLFPEGSDLYLSAVTAGAITATPPLAPARVIRVGYCVRSHATVGSIFVSILEHPDIVEIGSVLINTPQNNEVLMYEQSTGLWKNKAITSEGDEVLAKRINFVGEDIIYKAEAAVGTIDSQNTWRIRKITIAVDGDVSETWASGNSNYDKVWNDHLTYIYS
jgi:hypothetical protein